jgi:hypothetical protein
LLHHFKRVAVHWERRAEPHDAFISLAPQPQLLEMLALLGSGRCA